MNIIEFVQDKRFIADESLSLPQVVCLKSLYGLDLSDKEKGVYTELTKLEEYHPHEYKEATYICGRRSGKSNQLASNICIFEASTRDYSPYLSRGESAYIILIASSKRQARIVFNYVLGKLRGSEILNNMIERVTSEEIHLNSRTVISIFPCSSVTPRGISCTVLCADESAHYKIEGVNVDSQVINAIRPSMIQFPNSKLIKISSPYGRRGVVFEDYRDHFAKDSELLCIQASSSYMNPNITESFVEGELKRDKAHAKSEYLAQFREDVSDFISIEALDAVIHPGRFELPYNNSMRLSAFVDPSGGRGDSMTLSIANREEDGHITQVLMRSKKPPFNPKNVVKEFAEVLKTYNLNTCTGDRYSASWCSSSFLEEGIVYQNSELPKSQIYLEFLPLIMTEKVTLLDDKTQTIEFRNLERLTSRQGKDSVDHSRGQHDDSANSCAGACVLASSVEEFMPAYWIIDSYQSRRL